MKTPAIIIRHRRFVIRKYTADDMVALVQHFGHPEVTKGTGGKVWHYRSTDARKYLREKIRQYRRQSFRLAPGEAETVGYAIEFGGQLVGGVKATLDNFEVEIGYWLAKPLWGQGIMTAVVRAWTTFVFKKFRIKRIVANVFSFNLASVRVLQKSGFQFEARLINGKRIGRKYFDQLIFVRYKK